MPSREQVERAATAVAELRARHHGRIVIDAVVPDYYARYPKPCVGGWGRRSLNVTPAGKVLPCLRSPRRPGPARLMTTFMPIPRVFIGQTVRPSATISYSAPQV